MREFTIRSVGLLAALLLMDGAAIAQTASASSCNGFQCYERPPVCGDLLWAGVDTAPGPADCDVTTWGPCSFNPDVELAPIPIPSVIMPQSDRLAWKPVADAYDIVVGELGSLRASAGDYSVSTLRCLENDQTLTFLELPDDPANGEGFFYLLRAWNDFDTTGYNVQLFGGQIGDRDVGIGASGRDCPQ